MSVVTLE